MPYPPEYPIPMKLPAQRPISTTLALFGLLFLLVSLSSAQHESASANSSSSSHSSSASATSAMSPAHTGYAPSTPSGFTSSTNHSHSSNGPAGNGSTVNHGHPHHHSSSSGEVYYPYVYLVPFPYTAEVTDSSNDANDDDDEYQGGPTIFDRRGSGAPDYVAPTYEGPAHAPAAQDAPTEPEPPQPPTTLVFKNGNQLEIENYAIVSQTLYDLTPGHSRKIALADLDLAATEKQNDRGVTFQLPPQAN
jgi:hypothetical protein